MKNIEDALDQFLTYHRSAGHSARTVEWYGWELTRFFDWLKANRYDILPWWFKPFFEKYLAEARQAGNAPATVAGHYRALKSFFGWLTENGHLRTNPMVNMRPPKIPKTLPHRTTLEQYNQLMDAIGNNSWVDLRDRLLIEVMFLCGLRVSEALGLTAADFRTTEHLLVVRKGKGGHQRFVPLQPAVERAFIFFVFQRPPSLDDHLFLGVDGGGKATAPLSRNGAYQMLARRCRRVGLPVLNPHSFRHGLAMYLLNTGGADMSLVQKILGHSQITTTSRFYAEWLTDGMIVEFVARMGSLGR